MTLCSTSLLLRSRPIKIWAFYRKIANMPSQKSTNARWNSSPLPDVQEPPLSILSFTNLIRSLSIMSLTSSKVLLPPSLAVMNLLAHTSSRLLSPDFNPIIRTLLKMTFYKQFCAGQTRHEIIDTNNKLRSLGYSGVILCHAKERDLGVNHPDAIDPLHLPEDSIRQEITPWANSILSTISMVSPGDLIAIKFSGAGSHTLRLLSMNLPPSPILVEAVDSICEAVLKLGIRLLIDAEHAALQKALDACSLELMAKYNRRTPGKAVVYGTYQAYLKVTPSVISNHLKAASERNFTLGVKLVRGAYLNTDPRHLIHESKAKTDNAYDNIAYCLTTQSYGSILSSNGNEDFPNVSIVLATHNRESVRKILALRKEYREKSQKIVDVVFAQLYGMADEVSGEIILAKRLETEVNDDHTTKAYKYLVWGTMNECIKYLLRRAQENQDAVQRTKEGRRAIWKELLRRIGRKAYK